MYPIASPDYVVVSVNSPEGRGNVLRNDHDPQGLWLHVANTGTYTSNHGELILYHDGTYVFTVNSGYQGNMQLRAGESAELAFPVTITNGTWSTDTLLFITILGVDDPDEEVDCDRYLGGPVALPLPDDWDCLPDWS